jgi:hypothetical protein
MLGYHVDEAIAEDEIGVELDDEQGNANIEHFHLSIEAH